MDLTFDHIEDLSKYEDADEIDEEIEQIVNSDDEEEEEYIPSTPSKEHTSRTPSTPKTPRTPITSVSQRSPPSVRQTRPLSPIEEVPDEEYDIDIPRPSTPRLSYRFIPNQSRAQENYQSSLPSTMASSNVPKPGPAKLRPNSTPEEWLQEAKLCHYLPEDVMKQLCEMVKEHLMEESNIQPVSTPVVVCGDIHGQFYDLLELFRVAGGMPGETNVERPSTMITSEDLEPPDMSGMSIHDKKEDDDTVDEEESRGRPRTAGQSSRGASSGADSGVKVNEVSGNGCQNFIFLGDFVDRGYFSLETLTLLLCLKALYPAKITLVRGNHESRQITQVYGFYEECIQKYGNASVWKACCQVFDFLILSAIIDGQILCVHGGLSPEIRTLDQIRVVARAQEIPHEGAFCDLVWSDPDDIDTWGVSPRGAGWLFGEKVASEFNHVNGLKLIARAHQLVNEGFKYHFPSKNVVTVWSAPNYCYRCGNVASIMNVDANCSEKFSIFAAVPEEKRHVPSNRRAVGEYFL